MIEAVGFWKEIGEVIPKLVCDKCKAPPMKVEAEMVWAKAYGARLPREDLTFLLADKREAA